MASKFFERLAKDEVPIGTITLARGADWIETMSAAGMDYICIDQMLTGIDWAETAEMIRAACRFNVTPWVRLQAYPWASGDGVASHLGPDTLRALSLGAEVVVASVNTAAEVRAMLEPGRDQHRRPYIEIPFNNPDIATQELAADLADSTLIMPLMESRAAIDNLGEIVKVEGLKGVFLGMGDLSREYGTPGNDRSDAVRDVVRRVVDVAGEAGVQVFTSMPPRWDIEDSVEGGLWYVNAGTKMVWLPYNTFVMHEYYSRSVRAFREGLGQADA